MASRDSEFRVQSEEQTHKVVDSLSKREKERGPENYYCGDCPVDVVANACVGQAAAIVLVRVLVA